MKYGSFFGNSYSSAYRIFRTNFKLETDSVKKYQIQKCSSTKCFVIMVLMNSNFFSDIFILFQCELLENADFKFIPFSISVTVTSV